MNRFVPVKNRVLLLLAGSVFVGGCCRARQTQEDLVAEKKGQGMVRIQKFTLTDKTLTLDYQVSNPFDDDIRVCQDTSIDGYLHAVTRIDAETVWIKLRFCRSGIQT